MAEAPREDRLGRDELEALQQRALRTWLESDWLATHDPRTWESVASQVPGEVRVELGAGIGEGAQTPGWITVAPVPGDGDTAAPMPPDGQRPRRADLMWDFANGLPFEDATVDAVRLRSHVLTPFLERELARTVVLGGTVEGVTDAGALAHLVEIGFAPEGEGDRLRKVRHRFSLDSAAPYRVREHALGTLQIREPRRPIPG